MRRFLCLLLTAVLGLSMLGCGGNQEKGVNKERDKPREGRKESRAPRVSRVPVRPG